MFTGKGQSAIEYLMTYGWMLLVVAIVGGAVFSLIQGQAIESVSGFSGTEVSINDFGLNSDDELALSMRNTAADRVRIKAVELEDPETGATTRVLSEKQIEVGDRKTVKVDGFERTSSSNKQDLRVIYGSGGIDDQMVEGTITGKLKAKNHVYLQNAAFNRSTNTLNITAQNTGNTEADVEYIINSDSNSFTGNLGTLSSGETTSFTLNTDETFPMQNVSLNVEGQHFTNSQKQLKCTPTKGLIGYWPFEEGQGNTAYDYSGKDHDGGINGATWTKGISGSALRFDGEDDYVEVPSGFEHVRETFTVSVQLKRRGSTNTGIVNTAGYDWWLRTKSDFYQFEMWNKTPSENLNLNEGKGINLEKWHQVAGRYKEGLNASLYINGQVITVKDSIPNLRSQTDGLIFGNRHDYLSSRAINGSIAEVRVYNRTLTDQEIRRIYNMMSKELDVDACKFVS